MMKTNIVILHIYTDNFLHLRKNNTVYLHFRYKDKKINKKIVSCSHLIFLVDIQKVTFVNVIYFTFTN